MASGNRITRIATSLALAGGTAAGLAACGEDAPPPPEKKVPCIVIPQKSELGKRDDDLQCGDKVRINVSSELLGDHYQIGINIPPKGREKSIKTHKETKRFPTGEPTCPTVEVITNDKGEISGFCIFLKASRQGTSETKPQQPPIPEGGKPCKVSPAEVICDGATLIRGTGFRGDLKLTNRDRTDFLLPPKNGEGEAFTPTSSCQQAVVKLTTDKEGELYAWWRCNSKTLGLKNYPGSSSREGIQVAAATLPVTARR